MFTLKNWGNDPQSNLRKSKGFTVNEFYLPNLGTSNGFGD